MKDLAVDVLLIGLGASLLWHLSNIWRYGEYLVGEPNTVIRSVETAGLLFILAFGVVRFLSDLKREK